MILEIMNNTREQNEFYSGIYEGLDDDNPFGQYGGSTDSKSDSNEIMYQAMKREYAYLKNKIINRIVC